MRTGLNMEIALGLMRARFKQTLVAAAGVTFGIGMFITLISFMTGLNDLLDGLIINRTPHIRLYNEVKPTAEQPITQDPLYSDHQNFIHSVMPRDRGDAIYNAREIMRAVERDPRVIGVSPRLTSQAFFRTGSIEIAGVINGVDVFMEEKLFGFADNVMEGRSADLASISNSIFLGRGLANKLLAETGDVIQITTSKGEQVQLKVVGIFQVGLADFDNTQSYASIETVQKLMGETAAYITDIQVKLKDITQAPDMAKEYSKLYEVDAVDIQTANAQFETGSDVRSIISYAVGITLLIVAGFGIYNILNMLIYEKMDSIAILKATGFSGSDVKSIFISLSMIIGVAGGIIGLLLGFALSTVVDNIPFITPALPRINTFPVQYNPVYYFIGITFALITTYIAGLFPARKAAKIDPVIIIRGK